MSNKHLRHALEQAEDDVTQLREENEGLNLEIRELRTSNSVLIAENEYLRITLNHQSCNGKGF